MLPIHLSIKYVSSSPSLSSYRGCCHRGFIALITLLRCHHLCLASLQCRLHYCVIVLSSLSLCCGCLYHHVMGVIIVMLWLLSLLLSLLSLLLLLLLCHVVAVVIAMSLLQSSSLHRYCRCHYVIAIALPSCCCCCCRITVSSHCCGVIVLLQCHHVVAVLLCYCCVVVSVYGPGHCTCHNVQMRERAASSAAERWRAHAVPVALQGTQGGFRSADHLSLM